MRKSYQLCYLPQVGDRGMVQNWDFAAMIFGWRCCLMVRNWRPVVVFLAGAILWYGLVTAEQPESQVDFARHIYPLLQRECFECHGPQVQKNDLRFDQRQTWQTRPDVFSPGDPGSSELLRRVSLPVGDPEHMPANGRSLTAAQKALLRQWIADGAHWPESFRPAGHWAYLVPRRPRLPQVRNTDWPRQPIDFFILARMEAVGLKPSPEASRGEWLRRASLDLVGLPPSLEELDAFLNDGSPDAYERVVDRLLAAPQFGERWGRLWLDLARYADSHGFQRDDLHEIWPYRDWVIRAINADMPFDRFTIEQIAGDLLPEATIDQQVATGFHRCAPINVEAGSEPEESRVNQVFDRVNTTATVWLGTTLDCARCHDHKYDPFTQQEYYAFFAFFNNTEIEADRSDPNVPSSIRFLGPRLELPDEVRAGKRRQVQRELAAVRTAIKKQENSVAATLPTWVSHRRAALDPSSGDLPQAIQKLLTSDPSQWQENERQQVLSFLFEQDPQLRELRQQERRLQERLAELAPVTTLVMRELPEPRVTRFLVRGDYRQPADVVTPGVPAVLHPLPDGPPNRLTLARWLASPQNPLVARVTVNRWWNEIFGRGLVPTLEDFGVKGEPPTHPQLLDYLAVEFMENGWSAKHILRQIVLSSTYRQTALATPDQWQHDPKNAFYSRGPRFRMDAEMIRDTALALAGLLSLKQGGPPIRPYQPEGVWEKIGGQKYDYTVSPGEDQYRRGIYVVWKRGAPYPSFVQFDATNRLACTVKRNRTNTPLQALTLLNDPVYVEAAVAMACRVLTTLPQSDDVSRLQYAFRLATARLPDDFELAILRKLLDAGRKNADVKRSEIAKLVNNNIVSVSLPVEEVYAWYGVTSALLNLDETITK
ncbi:MAG: chromosome segregation protein [Pirellulaceae bacterium]|nr:MAG: chromosome segregation protein [Pirellulaceae bacterium]